MTRDHAQRQMERYQEAGEPALAELFRAVLRYLDATDDLLTDKGE